MFDFIEISTITGVLILGICFMSGILFTSTLYFSKKAEDRGYFILLLYFVLFAIGIALLAGREVLGNFAGIILANGFMIVSTMMIPIGVETIFKLPHKRYLYVGLFIVFVLIFIYSTYIIDLLAIRIYTMGAFTILIALYALYELYLVKQKNPDVREVLSLAIISISIIQILRMINFFIESTDTNNFLELRVDPFFLVLLGITNLFFIPGILSIYGTLREIELEQLTKTDSLTSLSNKRSLLENVKKVFDLSHRYQSYISVIMMDVDDFKLYNDKFGHIFGDKILQDIAKVLSSIVHRPMDIVSRFGGDEFTVVLYDCNQASALGISTIIQESIHQLHYFSDENQQKPLTVSIGYVSFIATESIDIDTIIGLADEYMYKVKADKNIHILGDEIDLNK